MRLRIGGRLGSPRHSNAQEEVREVREARASVLQQHPRQPQREKHAHDDHGDETHRAERLALNVSDAEQEVTPFLEGDG